MNSFIARLSSILLSILLLFSCRTIDPLPESNIKEKLLINCIMSTSDSVHNIYVAKSYVDSLAGIESPRLSFYVNGEKRYETSESVQEFSHSDKRFSKQKMTVKTRIEANDEIKIVLEAEGLSAEAEIIVPKTPKISKVEKYKLKEDSGEGYFWKFLPEVEDIKGEKNWYRF